jgi:transcriptional regulator with XRE-family HTH domain
MQPLEDPHLALARLLRELRLGGFDGVGLTQQQIAKAFGVSVPLISSWEKGVPPPVDRLSAYARLFASPRSLEHGRLRLLDSGEFTDEEQAREVALERELITLRTHAAGGPLSEHTGGSAVDEQVGPWRFPDGNTITIICAPLPSDLVARMPYAQPDDPDYVTLYNYADLDSLVELYGHIRAQNPLNPVTFKLSTDALQTDFTTHLVVLGGVDWNDMTRDLLNVVRVPVRQLSRDEDPAGAFAVNAGGRTERFQSDLRKEDGRRVLVSDVAHFIRGVNPFNVKRTVTVCSGNYGRGTYGVVRALIDPRFCNRNARYIRERFADAPMFSILTRVRMVANGVVTPDWRLPDTRLHEWPEATG